MQRKRNKKKFKLFFLMILFFFIAGLILFNLPTKNINIFDNELLNDQEIIDLANLTNYPNLYQIRIKKIKEDLLVNKYIREVRIKRVKFSQLHIFVVENKPVFFVDYREVTVLSDGAEVEKKYNVPILVNYVPNFVYSQFVEKMALLDDDILNRISEIKYAPNEVDEERFLLYMIDGNYVYINLQTFLDLNEYLIIIESIASKFGQQKGILNLDKGGYFQVFE